MKITPCLSQAASAVALLAATGCVPQQDDVAALFSDTARWVDLTYPFNAATIYWPTAQGFQLEKVADGETEAGYYYAANNFRAAEHGGTHLDAPVHFSRGKHAADQIPLAQLMGPAVVIDVSAKAEQNPDYQVTVEDIQAFEETHGPVAPGTIVLLRTGWGSRWPDRVRYLGTAATGPDAVPQLHFPGVDSEAARWLVHNRSVDAVGIDTPSIDSGQSKTFDTHQILYGADIPGFENVANLDRIPQVGTYVIALPMKIEGGSGGPLRIVAVVP